ncbi:MAG: hypothetical protein A3A44_01195 [Candidatus Sungbacteria bacterium RIFCSPLOWO2_01_FULL_60_25]|uniref:Sodium/calcium exchanger membrane region domain-containing protein n=1 Tax=Candidatus Sungbacteria bacterium RIFCSPLOWO2_01_FULL_60_25 TaxID=1802281 RepID=A0A1G2LEY1_9BACT|nr:MAG: hypothetical protein A3A44_01195 [Candidatus Sungbacteria bacterium RIFCSPLOWO2_01_FULL_60_25]
MSASSLLILAAAFITLFASGGMLVRALTAIGRMVHVSEFALAALLVAIATSLPEFFVGISSALSGVPSLSLGDLIGANVLNLTVILGIGILLSGGIAFDRSMRISDFLAALAVAVLPIILALDRVISRTDGIILLLACIVYFAVLLAFDREPSEVNNVASPAAERIFRESIRFVVGAFLLIVSSAIMVTLAAEGAIAFRLPILFVGILVAFGTTLPELVFAVMAARIRHGAMSLGNAVGTVAVNIGGILGFIALLRPIAISEPLPAFLGMGVTVALMAALAFLGLRKKSLSPSAGAFLVMVGVVFIVLETFLAL